jgi:uncharacterized RDD family membrane protein YckC
MLVIGGVFGVAYCTPDFPKSDSAGFQVALWLLFFSYHTISVVNPSIGIGRMLQGIEVIDGSTGHRPSSQQAGVRAAVRTTLAGVAAALMLNGYTEGTLLMVAGFEIAAMVLTPQRQSLADTLARTIVVSTPPYQPHKAPAAPMYSKDDKEFCKRGDGEA